MPESDFVNVARFLPERARAQPDGAAVRIPVKGGVGAPIEYHSLTFGELESGASGVASYLEMRGIHRGTRVLLMVKPGRDLILCVFALFKLGAVPVVIDPGMGLKGFLACVRRTQPSALLGIPLAHAVARICRRTFSGVGSRVVVGNRRFREAASLEGAGYPLVQTRGDELAAILFTSGSTGPAKGVCYEHRMFEAQVRLIRNAYGIAEGEIDLPMLPVFALFNPALGMTTVVPQMNPSRPATVRPEGIVRAIEQNGVTNSFGSPVLWRKIGRYCDATGKRLESLRRILMAGTSVPPDVVRLFAKVAPGAEVHTPYGATECLPVTTLSGQEILDETWKLTEAGAGSCVGRPVSEMRVAIVRPLDSFGKTEPGRDPVPAGEVGEIWVTGPVVTEAYDRLPEATARSKVKDGDGSVWHHMGDLGYLDEKGRLWFCGRSGERVEMKSGIFFTDRVEAIVNRQDGVYRSALLGIGKRGEQEALLAIEPEVGVFPQRSGEKRAFAARVRSCLEGVEGLPEFSGIVFFRRFPVDVRHNAKIHRLQMARAVADGKGWY